MSIPFTIYIVLLASGTTMDDTYYGTASLVEARVWPLAASPDPSTQAMLDILASTWRQMRLGALGIPADGPGGNGFGQLFLPSVRHF